MTLQKYNKAALHPEEQQHTGQLVAQPGGHGSSYYFCALPTFKPELVTAS